jgi:chlorophyllide a oxygenase
MQVVEVLKSLAIEFKSNGTLRKELAELQEELAKAHNQVLHLQESNDNPSISSGF